MCEICGKVFTALRNLKQHRHTVHEKSVMFSCSECDNTTPRKSSLNPHIKRHNDTPTTSNFPPKITRHKPILNIIKPTENDQFLQDIEHQELSDMLSTQVGFGVMQITPADEKIPEELRDFFEMNNHGEQTEIFDKFTPETFIAFAILKRIIAVPVSFLDIYAMIRAPLIETIAQALENIFHRQTNAFKIDLSFYFILRHRKTGEFRYHYASNNNQLPNSPKLIRNQQDLDNLLDFLSAKDFSSHLKDQRPNTKWVIERIVSLRIHLVMTTYPLGKPPHLPDYIKNNRFIIGLEKDQNTAKTYKDHLCFFCCLAIEKFGKTYHNCNQKAKKLFYQNCEHFEVNPQDFKGVDLTDFPQLEKYYETSLFTARHFLRFYNWWGRLN